MCAHVHPDLYAFHPVLEKKKKTLAGSISHSKGSLQRAAVRLIFLFPSFFLSPYNSVTFRQGGGSGVWVGVRPSRKIEVGGGGRGTCTQSGIPPSGHNERRVKLVQETEVLTWSSPHKERMQREGEDPHRGFYSGWREGGAHKVVKRLTEGR